MRTGICCLLVMVAPLVLAAPVYRSVDEQGRVVFSDEPSPGAEKVDVPAANTTPALEPRDVERKSSQPDFAGYGAVRIISPGDIVPNGLAGAAVRVELEPELQSGHRIQVLLDGEAVASGASTQLTIQQLPRGTHTLEVQVLGGKPEKVLGSGSREIFVYWPGGNR